MSTPDTLLQAALNRLAARASSSAIDAAAQLSLLAQDAPQKIRTDLQLFWEEVQAEADRLDGNPSASPQQMPPLACSNRLMVYASRWPVSTVY